MIKLIIAAVFVVVLLKVVLDLRYIIKHKNDNDQLL